MDLIHRRKDNIGTVNDQEYISKITLTKDGFDVAHEREQKKTQQQNNKTIALLTLILAITAILQSFADLIGFQGTRFKFMLVVFILFMITIAYVIWTKDPKIPNI
jgi:cation transport ATPase